ncbi:MAG: hypothetical protein JRI97_01820 [Deltaproteobacteria bacterium]|nr:hypothetical protein [Deltaproteobacteria bacterium]
MKPKRLHTAACPLLVLVLVFSLSACGEQAPKLMVDLPKDVPLSGCTPEGTFFLHDSMVQNLGGGKPRLVSGVTEWEPRDMTKKGDYWVFTCRDRKDRELWDFYHPFEIEYQFRVGREKAMPNQEFYRLAVFGPDDVVFRPDLGFVFETLPQDNPYIQAAQGRE